MRRSAPVDERGGLLAGVVRLEAVFIGGEVFLEDGGRRRLYHCYFRGLLFARGIHHIVFQSNLL